MGKIIFIDDEPIYVHRYVVELQRYHNVIFCESSIEGIEWIRKDSSFQALVLDIQLPAPDWLSPNVSNQGLDTGLWLLEDIREIIVSRPLPVIILTNRRSDLLTGRIGLLGVPEQMIEIRQKVDTSFMKLPNVVNAALQRWYH